MIEAWRHGVHKRNFNERKGDLDHTGVRAGVSIIEKAIGFDRAKLILELGCGAGTYSLELSRRGYLTVGIDSCEARLRWARQCAEHEGLTAQFARGEAHSLIYRAQFDVALLLCDGILGLEPDEDKDHQVLKRVATALKPHGLLIMTVPRSGYTQATLLSLLLSCGFTSPSFMSEGPGGRAPAALELGVLATKASLALALP